MLKYRKKVVVLISLGIMLILIAILTINIAIETKPRNMIKDKLEITLSDNCKVLNYDAGIINKHFNVKILVNSESVENLKEQLNNTFGGIANYKTSEWPNIENICQWWDLDKKSVIVHYNTFFSVKGNILNFYRRSYQAWAFISKDSSGQYYLYISYC